MIIYVLALIVFLICLIGFEMHIGLAGFLSALVFPLYFFIKANFFRNDEKK